MSTPATHRPVAIITGAAQGLGRAISVRLASDGFDVALNDLATNESALISLRDEIIQNNNDRKVVLTPGDVSEESAVKEMIEKAVTELGGLDVMVANAGIGLVKSIVDTSLSEWQRIQAINSQGVFLCYKYAALQMIAQGRGGRIIGASSVFGKQGPLGASAYGMSKFAVRGLTQSAAQEWAQYGINVNAYAPGYVDTDILKAIPAENIDQLKEANPLKRFGRAEEIGALVSYLVSKEAGFVTGQCVSINGGMYFD